MCVALAEAAFPAPRPYAPYPHSRCRAPPRSLSLFYDMLCDDDTILNNCQSLMQIAEAALTLLTKDSTCRI